jgi:hypothetical protein
MQFRDNSAALMPELLDEACGFGAADAEMQAALETLDTEVTELSSVIRHNVKQLIGDE